jgi:hypothetical protein
LLARQGTGLSAKVLASQHSAPSVPLLRNILSISTGPFNVPPPFQVLPQAAPTFLPAWERPSLVPHSPASTAQVQNVQPPAPPNLLMHDVLLPQTLWLASPLPLKQALHPVEAFPQAQGHIQVDQVPKTSRLPCLADACLVQPLCHNSLPLIPVQTSALPAPVVPDPLSQFLSTPQPFPLAPRYTLAC